MEKILSQVIVGLFMIVFLMHVSAAGVSISSLTVSNSSIDSNQNQTVNVVISGGTAPYTYTFNIINSTGVIVTNLMPAATNALSYAFTFPQSSSYGTGSFTANVAVIGSGGTTAKGSSAYTVNPALVTPATPTINESRVDLANCIQITVPAETGGTAPYRYIFAIANTTTNNQISGGNYGTNSMTFCPSGAGAGTGTYYANVLIQDSATSPVSVSSGYSSAFTVFSSTLSIPLPPGVSGSVFDNGQAVTLSVPAAISGFGPWTYNFYVINTTTLAVIYSSGALSTNSYTFTLSGTGDEEANVVIADSTGATASSSYSSGFLVNKALSVPSPPTFLYSTLLPGQSQLFSITASGGTTPYTYNFLIINASDGSVLSSNVVSTNVISLTFGDTGTYYVRVIVNDSATTHRSISSGLSSSFFVGYGSTTTSTTTSSSTTTTTVYTGPTLAESVNVVEGSPASIDFVNANATLLISTTSTTLSKLNVAIDNITSSTPSIPSTYKALEVLNVTVSPAQNLTLNLVAKVNCNANFTTAAPYTYNSSTGTWTRIVTFTSDKNSCSITAKIPADPIVGIFESAPYVPISTTSSTVPSTTTTVNATQTSQTTSSSDNTWLYVGIAAIVVIVILAYLFVRRRRATTFPYK